MANSCDSANGGTCFVSTSAAPSALDDKVRLKFPAAGADERSESNKKLGPYNITILKIHHCYERTTSRFILEIPVSLEKNMHKKQTKKRTLERKSE